jgi:hypothetical protein
MPRLPALAFLALFPLACGRPHDLGVGGSSTTSATGGGGAASTTSSSLTHSTSSAASTTSITTTSTTTADPGPTELTVVNGVVDYPAVRFCFLPDDTPWPAGTAGLAFAHGAPIAPLAPTIPAGADVTPWAIAGDLTQTAGKTCAELLTLAGTPGAPIVARPLGVVPAVVWTSNKSLLFVAQGCLGGASHDDLQAKQACGASYTPAAGSAGVTLLGMSRAADAGHVSLQAVSAAAAITTDLEVRIQPAITGTNTVSVATLAPGAIGPVPPFAQLTASEYGALDAVILQGVAYGVPTPANVKLPDALANGPAGAADFVDGARLVLVGVGASPSLPAAKWWRGFTFAIVKSDPM